MTKRMTAVQARATLDPMTTAPEPATGLPADPGDPADAAPRPAPVPDRDDADDSTGSYELEARGALRRVAGLSTELADITEVEYRQLRLERVVLVGVWTEGTQADADRSLAELAALAETAGSQVLEAVSQRDYPIITGVFLIVGVAVVFINLLVDLSYGLLDPKVRYR